MHLLFLVDGVVFIVVLFAFVFIPNCVLFFLCYYFGEVEVNLNTNAVEVQSILSVCDLFDIFRKIKWIWMHVNFIGVSCFIFFGLFCCVAIFFRMAFGVQIFCWYINFCFSIVRCLHNNCTQSSKREWTEMLIQIYPNVYSFTNKRYLHSSLEAEKFLFFCSVLVCGMRGRSCFSNESNCIRRKMGIYTNLLGSMRSIWPFYKLRFAKLIFFFA